MRGRPKSSLHRADVAVSVLLVCFGLLAVAIILATTLPRWKPLAWRKREPVRLGDLQTGDIVFTSPRRNLQSSIFQPFARSTFSHVAMAVRCPDGELFIYESDPVYGGAHLTPISTYAKYIKQDKAVAFVRLLVPSIQEREANRMRRVVSLVSDPSNIDGMYDYGVWSSQLRHLMPMSRSTKGTFCSSAVVEALVEAGILANLTMHTSHIIMNDMTSARQLLSEKHTAAPYRYTSEIPLYV